MRTHSFLALTLFTGLALSSTLHAASAESAEIQELREQIRALDHQLLVLERKQEIQDEKVTVSDKGFALASADAANSIKLRGLVQLDSRVFFHDGGGVLNNSFVLRRARLITEGVFAKNYSFQLVPEFGGTGAVSIVDANLGIAVSKALQLKFGKFKSPVGLELLQSDSWTFFNERSIVTNLVPNRDLGVQAAGELFNGTLNYAAGVFGGVADGGSTTNADFDNDKDIVTRLIAAPFKNETDSPLQGLAFGVSGSVGREKTAAGRTSGYKTDGQQTFFSYAATTVADGQNWRISPQVDFRNGSLGVIGEYVISTVNVRPSATGAKTELQNQAWQLALGYVLTGENSAYTGVVPRNNFDFSAGTWGALEITARYANLKVDDNAFPVYASVATNADEASSVGVGLNWYLSKTVALKLDYYQTRFGFNSAAPAVSGTQILRQDEKALISRLQLSF
jgi:phosphate-selective porin OprO and OprP